ncbi:hypothetical protein [Planococcus sp. ISL-109]|uniref:hypothetical protein n=1 Tax=Planococcus sp. ISL-109 TaxID=2819166 RepID=UPI0033382EBE
MGYDAYTAGDSMQAVMLDEIKGVMHASGEGRWTVETVLELEVPAPVIAMSLMMRDRSREVDSFSGKVVAAMRREFRGHAIEANTEKE